MDQPSCFWAGAVSAATDSVITGSVLAAGSLAWASSAAPEGVLHRRLHGLAHRPAEADPAGQLLGHALRDQLRIRLGALHLEDVQLHLLAGELLQVAPDPVRLSALAADDDARPGRVDVDAHAVTRPLDVHLG